MQYQYKVIRINEVDEDSLNELGENGWELVLTNYFPSTGEYLMVFKRESWPSSPYFSDGGVSSGKSLPAWLLK